MPSLALKPTHKPVKHYHAALQHLAAQGATHEGAVKTAFQGLLEACASRRQWTLLGEYEIRRPGKHPRAFSWVERHHGESGTESTCQFFRAE